MVRIDSPPPERSTDPLIYCLDEGSSLLRLYRPNPYGSSACGFRYEGPFSRFDHHVEGIRRGIHYSAMTFAGCIVEVFGDTGLIEPEGHQLGLLRTNRPIAVLDLRGPGAMRAGSVAALSATADRRLSQAWARFFYDACSMDGRPIEGLMYSNAHNSASALALFERAEGALTCEHSLALSSHVLRSRLLAIARDHAMSVVLAS